MSCLWQILKHFLSRCFMKEKKFKYWYSRIDIIFSLYSFSFHIELHKGNIFAFTSSQLIMFGSRNFHTSNLMSHNVTPFICLDSLAFLSVQAAESNISIAAFLKAFQMRPILSCMTCYSQFEVTTWVSSLGPSFMAQPASVFIGKDLTQTKGIAFHKGLKDKKN